MPEPTIFERINQYANDTDTDLLIYAGPIEFGEDDVVINTCRKARLRKNVLLFIYTYGGNPDVAYRIARCLQQAYKTIITKPSDDPTRRDSGKFTVVIDGPCKSAGTLLALGACEIYMSGNGHLGPIDTQLRQQEEVGKMTSGLTPLQALEFLESRSAVMFNHYFRDLRGSIGFPTRLAAETASSLTTGLLSNIYSQIDPVRLGEFDRGMKLAEQYAQRVKTDNVRDNALPSLLAGYPSHGFVIDRTEATKSIFQKVEKIPENLIIIRDFIRHVVGNLSERNEVLNFMLSKALEPVATTPEDGDTDA